MTLESLGVGSCLVALCLMVGLAHAQGTVRTIEKGAQSNVDDALKASARTDAEWAALWKKHNGAKPAPKIDFSKEMVVAVFMGSRPTAGFAVEIVSAAERNGKLVVSYRETLPGPGTVSAQVLTAPYHLAAVPRTGSEVAFEKVND